MEITGGVWTADLVGEHLSAGEVWKQQNGDMGYYDVVTSTSSPQARPQQRRYHNQEHSHHAQLQQQNHDNNGQHHHLIQHHNYHQLGHQVSPAPFLDGYGPSAFYSPYTGERRTLSEMTGVSLETVRQSGGSAASTSVLPFVPAVDFYGTATKDTTTPNTDSLEEFLMRQQSSAADLFDDDDCVSNTMYGFGSAGGFPPYPGLLSPAPPELQAALSSSRVKDYGDAIVKQPTGWKRTASAAALATEGGSLHETTTSCAKRTKRKTTSSSSSSCATANGRRRGVSAASAAPTAVQPCRPVARHAEARKEREMFKRETHYAAVVHMSNHNVRMPSVHRKNMETFDHTYEDFNNLQSLLRDDEISLSCENSEIMFYTVVRPTKELVRRVNDRCCDTCADPSERRIRVLVQIADIYNRILHKYLISAYNFIKKEWTDRDEYVIFSRQRKPIPEDCFTDGFWLKRYRPNYVVPFDPTLEFDAADPLDRPKVDFLKSKSSKLKQVVTTYILGFKGMVQAAGVFPGFESKGSDKYAFKSLYKIMKQIPLNVMCESFSWNMTYNDRAIDSLKVYLSPVSCEDMRSADDLCFQTYVEKFLMMYVNSLRLYDLAKTINMPSPPVDPMFNVVLHNTRYREQFKDSMRLFYYRNDGDYLASYSVLDDVGVYGHEDWQNSDVYFYDIVSAHYIFDEMAARGTCYLEDGRVADEKHTRAVYSQEIMSVTNTARRMLRHSVYTANYKRHRDDQQQPYDGFYKNVPRTQVELRLEKLFFNRLMSGGKFTQDEDAEIAHLAKLVNNGVEHLTTAAVTGFCAVPDAVTSTVTATTATTTTATTTSEASTETQSQVAPLPLPVKRIIHNSKNNNNNNINNPNSRRSRRLVDAPRNTVPVVHVESVDAGYNLEFGVTWTDEQKRLAEKGVTVRNNFRNFKRTSYLNETGDQRSVYSTKSPPEDIDRKDVVLRVFKLKWLGENTFAQEHHVCVVFRDMPRMEMINRIPLLVRPTADAGGMVESYVPKHYYVPGQEPCPKNNLPHNLQKKVLQRRKDATAAAAAAAAVSEETSSRHGEFVRRRPPT